MATTAPKKSSKFLKILLLAVLVIGISIAGTFILLKQFGGPLFASAQTAQVPEKPAPVPKPIFLPLEPFTVTLNEPQSSRILYTEISLRVLNDESSQQLQTYMPEVRSRVLAELAKFNSTALQTPEGRAQLTQNLINALQAPYDARLTAPSISSVLFTAFVIQ
ncbi:MAG TPA: flagellar basal body-associated FliL family protein [Eoetvoesiella sp.]|uniref:flagellar basal body-associated FliL family protein n=1 Tax=Eoetvoesiella sp. TaxID=1966355 RepID=UPI002C1A4497|nr:flagellar basal body-associated FliL family protein [Eoetvoesiella sp.]HWK59886.1 flagellar basal body-associated FliL family protein [Eoetvoesiella sp.]